MEPIAYFLPHHRMNSINILRAGLILGNLAHRAEINLRSSLTKMVKLQLTLPTELVRLTL